MSTEGLVLYQSLLREGLWSTRLSLCEYFCKLPEGLRGPRSLHPETYYCETYYLRTTYETLAFYGTSCGALSCLPALACCAHMLRISCPLRSLLPLGRYRRYGTSRSVQGRPFCRSARCQDCCKATKVDLRASSSSPPSLRSSLAFCSLLCTDQLLPHRTVHGETVSPWWCSVRLDQVC